MKPKTTAIVLATVLASPLFLTKVSIADGRRGPSNSGAPKAPATKISFEAEMKNRLIGAEGEAEYTKRTKGADTQEKFAAEFEIVKPNSLNIDETTIGLEIHVNGMLACTFKTPGTLETELKHGQTIQKVEFRASIQKNTVGGLETVKEVGDCGKLLPAVQVGDTAEVFLNGTQTPILAGTLDIDD